MLENKDSSYIDIDTEDPDDFGIFKTCQENNMSGAEVTKLDGLLQYAIDTGINLFELLSYQNQDRPWDRRFIVYGINK